MHEGLSRHDAIHAIGMVLTRQLYKIMKENPQSADPNSVYYGELENLTAESWLNSFNDEGNEEIKAVLHMKQNRAEAIRMLSDYLKITPGQAAKTYDTSIRAFTDDGYVPDKGVLLDLQRRLNLALGRLQNRTCADQEAAARGRIN
jgi:hypothetical protein